MGERNSPDAGETTLAAATAAIITARWPSRPTSPYGESGLSNGHAPNGTASNGTAPNGTAPHGSGYANGGFAEFAPPATALSEPTFDGLSPVSPAPTVSSAPPV